MAQCRGMDVDVNLCDLAHQKSSEGEERVGFEGGAQRGAILVGKSHACGNIPT